MLFGIVLPVVVGLFSNTGTGFVFAQEKPFPCTYCMCQFEKENIDTVILNHARESRTVTFGEIHDTVLADAPLPVEDSMYVISLLPKLRAVGYRYLALEVKTNAVPGSHSHDMVRLLRDHRGGADIDPCDYPHAKAGWVELMVQALELGFEPVFTDRAAPGRDRDAAMFQALKKEVFDRDPNARVLVYVGANHISELENRSGFSSLCATRKPLGLLLHKYTRGRNYSVYMGSPKDTPVACDLFISHFIWESHRLYLQQEEALNE